MLLRPALLLLLALPGPPQGAGEEVVSAAAAPRYAALPWRDLTASPRAMADLTQRFRAALAARGAEFADPAVVEEVLYRNRIRYIDTLSARASGLIAEATGCDYIMLGTLLQYDPRVPPRVGLVLRVLDGRTGERLSSVLVSAAGEDFTGLLLLGTIEEPDELALELLARALEAFGPDGAPLVRPAGFSDLPSARPSRAISAFQEDSLRAGGLDRVALLPLVDRSDWPNAAAAMDEVLAHVWFDRAGVQVIENSELRAAMVRERVRSIDQLDFERMRRIGESVGARYFMMGTLQEYRPEVPADGELVPELELFIRLFDTVEERVVAGAAVRCRGDDYRTVLGLGTVFDPIELSRRAALSAVAIVGGSE